MPFNFLRRFSLFHRLVIGNLCILAGVVFLGGYTTIQMNRLNRLTRSVNDIDRRIISIAGKLRDSCFTQRAFEKKYLISRDRDFLRQFSETGKYITAGLNQIGELVETSETCILVENATDLYRRYITAVEKARQPSPEITTPLRETASSEEVCVTGDMERILEEMIDRTEARINNKIKTSHILGLQIANFTIIMTVVLTISATVLAFFHARSINNPLQKLIQGTRDIARGNFNHSPDIQHPPEIRELAVAFNRMCDRLKEIDEMKADLIAHISHELKTPLTVIREAASLLEPNETPRNPLKTRSRVQSIISEECERLIDSVNRILDLSRMEAGMETLQVETDSLLPILHRSVSKFNPLLTRKHISLSIEASPDLPLINIDAEKIAQVIDNLLGNAIKFTPESGYIILSAALISLKSPDLLNQRQSLRHILVSVADTGCGIPKDAQKAVFQKFRTFHGKGTGLGLYIARHIVHAHGGRIWIKSAPGKGSTFFFTLPA